jgi:hypothetical protein
MSVPLAVDEGDDVNLKTLCRHDAIGAVGTVVKVAGREQLQSHPRVARMLKRARVSYFVISLQPIRAILVDARGLVDGRRSNFVLPSSGYLKARILVVCGMIEEYIG